MKKNIRLTLSAFLLLSLLCLAMLFTACGDKNPDETTDKPETPYEVLADVVEKTVKAHESDSADLLKNALTGGSIEANLTPAGELSVDTLLPFDSLAVKSYYGENKALQTLRMTSGSHSLDFSLFETPESSIITSSALDGAYGATYENASSFIEDMLGDMSDSSGFTEAMAELPGFASAFSALMKKALPLIDEHAVITPELTEDDLRIALEISSKDLAAFARECIALAKADEDFMTSLNVMLVLLKAAGEVPTLDSLLEDSGINDLLSEAEAANTVLRISIVATRSRVIEKITVSAFDLAESEEGVVKISADHFTLTLLISDEGGITIDAESGDETLYFDYDITDTESRRKVMISVGVTGVTLTPITYTYGKLDNSYTLSLTIPTVFSAELKGKITRTDDSMTVTLDSSSITDLTGSFLLGTTALPFKGSVTVKASDEMPQAPASYKEITDLTEEELAAVTEALMEDPIILSIIEFLALFATPDEDIPTTEEQWGALIPMD